MKIKNILKKYWPLLLVLLVGGGLRFYGLLNNPISLYSDEVDMGYQAYSLLKTGCDYSGFCLPIQFHSFSDVQPPIPIYLIALVHFLGVGLDLSIRLVPAIFGVLGIIATYFLMENLTSRIIFDLKLKNLGLMASAILALIPWHLTYSRIGFSLALLYFFVTTGTLLFTEYLIKRKDIYLYLSCLFLGLSPMVYNTAKMSVLFYPFLLLLLPGAFELFKRNTKMKVAFAAMYIPLCVMFISGGTTARFDYISIFTDPTAPTEINYQRLLDSGPNLVVGTSPSTVTKFFHNKPLWFTGILANNAYNLLSTDFLFINGDSNLRHSPANWGMLTKSILPVLLFGIFFLIRFRHDRLITFLVLLTTVSMTTSVVTRDGGNHASRSFMMILPLVIVSGIGLAYLKQVQKLLFYILSLAIIIESIFFIHDYWFHYRYLSERSWSAGMKELIQAAKKYSSQPIAISPKYENPLIFFAYYTEFDPKKFQNFVKTNTLYNNTQGNNNLEGNKIGDTNLYIATPVDYKNISANSLPSMIYFLTKSEVDDNHIDIEASTSAIIKLPSGEPLYYEIHY